MESNREKHPHKENPALSVEQVAASGEELLQKAHRISQSIEERIRKLLRDEDTDARRMN
jgi:hypothetical protein